jgi:hypothetical protein
MPIAEVVSILDRIRLIHEKKNQDYSAPGQDYENFQRAMTIMSWFKHDEDKVFACLIGVKLARLATLLNSGNKPNNESIDDSFLDHETYSILWHGFRMRYPITEKSDIRENLGEDYRETFERLIKPAREKMDETFRNIWTEGIGDKITTEKSPKQS